MPADNEPDPLDRWLKEQVRPLPPPPGTFALITRRARRRKIRKAVVTVASAAAVAAAVAVAVPVGMSLHLATPSTSAAPAAGVSHQARPTQSTLGKETPQTSTPKASATSTATPSPSTSTATAGYLPPDFVPSSVTWDSLTTGWVMGVAGTAGKCANPDPDICTSIARTDDGGQTWHGLPAPDTTSPGGSTGVSGLRFLNATDGWAYGPELWATDNGGQSWHKVGTGGQSVTALEASEGRAYALFGDCPNGIDAGCTSYTLMTSVAGSDTWTPVAGLPASLTTATGGAGGAQILLVGATGSTPAAGYLAAPDGILYMGALDGTAWEKMTNTPLPCLPQPASDTGGTPARLLLAAAGVSASFSDRLGAVCELANGISATYLSQNAGASWQRQVGVLSSNGSAQLGIPESLTALGNGTLVLATTTGEGGTGGIYVWSGSQVWAKATLSDPADAGNGFSYVGMTSTTQGVALGGSGDGTHAIWMTADGGKSWQLRPIQS